LDPARRAAEHQVPPTGTSGAGVARFVQLRGGVAVGRLFEQADRDVPLVTRGRHPLDMDAAEGVTTPVGQILVAYGVVNRDRLGSRDLVARRWIYRRPAGVSLPDELPLRVAFVQRVSLSVERSVAPHEIDPERLVPGERILPTSDAGVRAVRAAHWPMHVPQGVGVEGVRLFAHRLERPLE